MTLLMLALLAGQSWTEQAEPYRPNPADAKQRSAEGRKEARDRALRVAGKEANAFCKHYAEQGVQAILACQKPETAKALVQLFDSGELQKLPNAKAALEAVCKHGEPAAAFLAANCARLADPDALECFVAAPLDYAYELRDLDLAASERRSSRGKGSGFNVGHGWDASDWKTLGFCGAVLLATFGAGYWVRSRRTAPSP